MGIPEHPGQRDHPRGAVVLVPAWLQPGWFFCHTEQHLTQPELVHPKEKVTRYFWAAPHHFYTKTLYRVVLPGEFAQHSPRKGCQTCPRSWAWGKQHTASASPSPGVQGRGLCLIWSQCAQCGHGGKCERGKGFGEVRDIIPGTTPQWAPSSTTGGTWPGCRKGLSGLGDPSVQGLAELHVFALQNLLWVSVLRLQEACALCK